MATQTQYQSGIPISPPDRIKYFKGLLSLVRKQEDGDQIRNFVNILGFDQAFFDFIVKNIVDNRKLINDPPQFSNLDLAKLFIKDGIKVAFTDNTIHLAQFRWLRATAIKNHLSDDWFMTEMFYFLNLGKFHLNRSLEIEKHERNGKSVA